jgi:hypothetical protein
MSSASAPVDSGGHSIQALDAKLLASVHSSVKQKRNEALQQVEAAAVEAFAERLDVVGKMRFGKEDKQAGMTPQEAARILKTVEDLRREKEKLGEQAARAEEKSRVSAREMQRLQGSLATAAADRETLLQTLLACRKELARKEAELAQERDKLQARLQAESDQEAAAGTISQLSRTLDDRGRLLQVTSLLEHERRALRDAREELRRERALRTEAETVLRTAIAEAKAQLEEDRQGVMARALDTSAKRSPQKGGSSPRADELLPAPSRAAVLEEILAKEAILSSLMGCVFPLGHQRALDALKAAEGAAKGGPEKAGGGK